MKRYPLTPSPLPLPLRGRGLKVRGLFAFLSCSVLFLLLQPVLLFSGEEKVRIVATTATLASLVREVTGDRADIYGAAPPGRDLHFYAPTPRDVLKVKKADVLVHMGLDLEAWRDPLLVAAGNPDFLGRRAGAIDVSKGVPLLEIPSSLSRSQGDIHAYGNPHYWLDPENAKIMVRNIAEGLARLFPEEGDVFQKNASAFSRRADEKIRDWQKRLAPYRGSPVVTFHKSWSYFAERFGLEILGELEPKPGIPPTPKHLAELSRMMREKGVKIILKESFQESRTPKKVARETGAKVLTLVQDAGEIKEAPDYLSAVEHNVKLVEEALSPSPSPLPPEGGEEKGEGGDSR